MKLVSVGMEVVVKRMEVMSVGMNVVPQPKEIVSIPKEVTAIAKEIVSAGVRVASIPTEIVIIRMELVPEVTNPGVEIPNWKPEGCKTPVPPPAYTARTSRQII
jgi:hypothetical protein